jgi:hypothetical protein
VRDVFIESQGSVEAHVLADDDHYTALLIDDHFILKNGKLKWHHTDVNVSVPQGTREALIKNIVVKCYVPSFDISPAGSTEHMIRKVLGDFLRIMKPFVLE